MSTGGWSSRRSKPVVSEGDVVDLGAKFGIAVGSDSDSSDAEFAPENEEKDSADSLSGDCSSGEEGGDEKEEEENEEEEIIGEEEEKEEEEEEKKYEQEKEQQKENEKESRKVDEKKAEVTENDDSVSCSDKQARGQNGNQSNENTVPENQEVDRLPEESTEGCKVLPTADVEDKKMEEEGEETSKTPAEVKYNPLVVRRSNRTIKPTKDFDLYLLGAKFGIDVDELGGDTSDVEFAPAEDSPDSVSVSSEDEESGRGGRKGKEALGETMEIGEEASTLHHKAQSEDDLSQSVSEFSTNQEAVQTKVEVHISLCAVCLEDSLDGDIVECDRCGIPVHEGCYGVPEEDGVDDSRSNISSFTTIPWFCDTCKAGVDPSTCPCELCPCVGGLYKQATNGRWVHMVCSLYTPGIEYVEPTLLSGITLDCMPASRWGAKRCQLCEDEFYSKCGVCISCDAGLCKSYFHVTCAQQYGLLCEMGSDEENSDIIDPYFAHCKAHSDKSRDKRKRRDYLAVINKQKRFKFDMSDDRILNYLSEAKDEYSKFFKKMLNYYRPELTLHLEERLFHFQPSALKRLSLKAQLLGYSVEMEQGVSRRKIAPDLTCEFVNHFNDRQSRTKDLQEMEKKLASSHTELREQELKLKQQVSQLKKDINCLRVESHSLRRAVTTLYVSMERITGEHVAIPNEMRLEEEEEEELEKEEERIASSGLPACTVCSKREDAHLMILCDTCDKHYHIMCLDPPLSRMPKKTNKWGWQCHTCCFESGDDMVPTIAGFDEHASRCGRKINAPKVFTYPDDQVLVNKVKKKKKK